MNTALFKDRYEAGKKLAERLEEYKGRDDVVVLGLPRGGVPVASEVAKELDVTMDIFLVRKLGLPGQEELAMGAIASGGGRVLNEELVDQLQIPAQVIEQETKREQTELERRERAYRGERKRPEVNGKTVILIDDGLATGASMRAAVAEVRAQGAAKIVVAVPTASPEVCAEFQDEVDEVVCYETPRPFGGVGAWYEEFAPTLDDEVRKLLEEGEKN